MQDYLGEVNKCKFSELRIQVPAWKRITPERARYSPWVSIGGGGGGIRTPETLPGLTVFKTAAFNHSATPPLFSVAAVRLCVISLIFGVTDLINDYPR